MKIIVIPVMNGTKQLLDVIDVSGDPDEFSKY